MRSGFSSGRARLAASVTALVGLSAVSGCAPRVVSDADRVRQPVAAPQPAVAPQPISTPQPGIVQQPQEVFTTTQAIGEEDGAYPAPVDQFATTYAIGEEDGTGPIPVEPGGGIGSGAGPIPFDTSVPSGFGEVEGEYERVYIPPAPSAPGQATTFAIGEEG